MKEGKAMSENKGLIILLCILVVVIVGLGVGVGVVINRNAIVGEYEDAGLYATEVYWDIEEKLSKDDGYSLEDAEYDYEQAMMKGDNDQRIYTAINYSGFVYDETDDLDRAVDILNRAEPLANNDNIKIDLYVAYRALYDNAGVDEMVDYYNDILDVLSPVDTRPIEELVIAPGEQIEEGLDNKEEDEDL